ncbi:MAG: flap endonuclease-1 [Candidatus Aenigmatarchaeota archaeon]|nr:flap endonuclease-1 [Candidatus Aenigmarchaeota archaeon]
MGVQISEIFPKKTIEIEELKGRIFAVDAFLWLHQFLSIIRQTDGTPLMDSKGRITSHLSGIFYRNAKLLTAGIKTIWVFDGKPPDFKHYTTKLRSEIKEEALKQWREAIELGDIEAAKRAAQSAVYLTKDIIEQSKELLQYMGIPIVQAPSEGEAQCAQLCKENIVWAVASQDADSLLFGAQRLLRNLSISGKRKIPNKNVYIEVKPELIELKDVLSSLKISRDQLIFIGLLVGTDFNPGIKGYGPKRSLELASKIKDIKEFKEKVKWDWEVPPEEIYNFFLNPPVEKNIKINFPKFQEEKIKKMLVDEFEFSEERINNTLEELKKISEVKQTGLLQWRK